MRLIRYNGKNKQASTLTIMTTRAKYLLAIPSVLLLAVVLLLYRLPDVTVFIVERELRAAGFTDIVLDIKAITTSQSKITTLRANHPAFSLRADEVTLHYTLAQLLDARIEEFEIASLQLTILEQHEEPGGTTLPTLSDSWLSAVPFNRAQIKQARLELSEPVQGITNLDLQTTITRSDSALDAQLTINTVDRPPVLLQLTVGDDNTLMLTLNDKAPTPPVLTLRSRELTVTPDKLSTALAIEADLGALRSLAAQWLPEQSLPGLFDSLSSEGNVEYIATDNRLGADLDMTLTGVDQVLRGPFSLTYQPGQYALVLKESFNIEARKQDIAQASLPELQLSVKDDINCVYMLAQAAWQCGSARMSLALPELHYPPYTMRSESGMVTLHNLSGERNNWQVNADLDLPAVKLVLPDNVIRLDRVHAQLQASSEELKATADLQAADGKLVMSLTARHDMLQQHGKAEIDLQPVSLDATHNIPGKLLRRWPYPVHIEAGKLVGKSSVSWKQKNGQFTLDQTALVQLDNIQGRYRQYPFSGLRGKLLIKGIDALRITSSDGVRLASINPGLPFTDILVRADALRQGGKAFVINLQQLEAMTLGGKISADKTVLDFNRDENRLTLNVQGLDIAELIKLEQKKGLVGTGKLNGKLPIILSKDGLQMSAGKLSAQPPYGVIQYSGDERVTELAKSNPNVELLLKALSDFHYDLLKAELDYAPDGQLLAKVRLQGNNPELEGGRPVHLNINLEENILTLLRSLQFADEISRKIGEGIEQGTQRP